MFSKSTIAALLVLTTTAFADVRTSAPAGCLVVSKTPPSGGFSTIQAAVNALSTTSVTNQCIWIDQGTYAEQVYIPNRRAPLKVYGYTKDTTSYYNNAVTITNKAALASGAANDDMTATLRVWTSNFMLYNVNVYNTYGQAAKDGQALAISASADKQAYMGVVMKGYQDTLMAQTGKQFYGRCYIEGATDFIFGQHAVAWFDYNDIRIVGPGYVTASGRASDDDASIYVFNKANIQAATKTTATTGQGYLGRPWGDYARVVFQNSYMTNIINPAGWRTWTNGGAAPGHASFFEFGNTGDGATGTRASFSKKISAAYKIADVLGSDYASWVDTKYIG